MSWNSSLVSASSAFWPPYITTTRSARPAMTPMSWVMSRTPMLSSVAQVVDDVEDLGLDRHVQRGRGLVGDQQLGPAHQAHRDDHALAKAARELEGVLVEALGRSGHLDHLEDLEGALARLLVGRPLVDPQALADLAADLHGRVERTHRVLGDQRDRLAALLLHLLLARGGQVHAVEDDVARRRRARCWANRRMIARPVVVLPQPDSPTKPTHSPDSMLEREVVDGGHVGLASGELNLQVIDREQRRHSRPILLFDAQKVRVRRGPRRGPSSSPGRRQTRRCSALGPRRRSAARCSGAP